MSSLFHSSWNLHIHWSRGKKPPRINVWCYVLVFFIHHEVIHIPWLVMVHRCMNCSVPYISPATMVFLHASHSPLGITQCPPRCMVSVQSGNSCWRGTLKHFFLRAVGMTSKRFNNGKDDKLIKQTWTLYCLLRFLEHPSDVSYLKIQRYFPCTLWLSPSFTGSMARVIPGIRGNCNDIDGNVGGGQEDAWDVGEKDREAGSE